MIALLLFVLSNSTKYVHYDSILLSWVNVGNYVAR